MEAGIDVNRLAGDAAGVIAQQERSGLADFLHRDVAAQRRHRRVQLHHLIEVTDSRRTERLERSRAERVDSETHRAEFVSGIRHRTFQCGLANTHDVVAGDDFLAAQIRQRQDAAAWSENRSRAVHDGQQAVDADLHRHFEAVAAARDGQSLEVVDRSIRHRVQHKVDGPELFLRDGENVVEVGVILHVAGDEEFRTDRFDEFFDTAFHLRHRRVFVGQVGETHLGPFLVQTLGDRPGDRMIVGDPEDQTLFASKHAHCE